MCILVQVVNVTYKTNLMKLKNFVMIKFNNDSVVQPRESEVSLNLNDEWTAIYGSDK